MILFSRNDSLPIRKTLTLNGYIGMVETFSNYQLLKQKDPVKADRLSNDYRNR